MPRLNELWIVAEERNPHLADDEEIYLTEREARETAKYFAEKYPADAPYRCITLDQAVRNAVRVAEYEATTES